MHVYLTDCSTSTETKVSESTMGTHGYLTSELHARVLLVHI